MATGCEHGVVAGRGVAAVAVDAPTNESGSTRCEALQQSLEAQRWELVREEGFARFLGDGLPHEQHRGKGNSLDCTGQMHMAVRRLNDVDRQAWLADVLCRIVEVPHAGVHELLLRNWRATRDQALAA